MRRDSLSRYIETLQLCWQHSTALTATSTSTSMCIVDVGEKSEVSRIEEMGVSCFDVIVRGLR